MSVLFIRLCTLLAQAQFFFFFSESLEAKYLIGMQMALKSSAVE